MTEQEIIDILLELYFEQPSEKDIVIEFNSEEVYNQYIKAVHDWHTSLGEDTTE